MNDYQKEIVKAIDNCNSNVKISELVEGEFIRNGIFSNHTKRTISFMLKLEELKKDEGNCRGLAIQICKRKNDISEMIDQKKEVYDVYNYAMFGYDNPYKFKDQEQLLHLMSLAGISRMVSDIVFTNFKPDNISLYTLIYLKIIENELKSSGLLSFLLESDILIDDSHLDKLIAFSLLYEGDLLKKLSALYEDSELLNASGFLDILVREIEIIVDDPLEFIVTSYYGGSYISLLGKAIIYRMKCEKIWEDRFLPKDTTVVNFTSIAYALWRSWKARGIAPGDEEEEFENYIFIAILLFQDLGDDWIDLLTRVLSFKDLNLRTKVLDLAMVAKKDKSLYMLGSKELIELLNDPYKVISHY